MTTRDARVDKDDDDDNNDNEGQPRPGSMAVKEQQPQQPFSRSNRVIGLFLLGAVVFMWTASNFLASSLLADRSYNKPYMVTYINCGSFAVFLVPIFIRKALRNPDELRQFRAEISAPRRWLYGESKRHSGIYSTSSEIDVQGVQAATHAEEQGLLSRAHQPPDDDRHHDHHDDDSDSDSDTTPSHHDRRGRRPIAAQSRLSISSTARTSLDFSILWFLANYFVTACLSYTTVASSTILTSTSSIFTLFIGSYLQVEKFTLRKTVGVLASFSGVTLISLLDASGSSNDDGHRGAFPRKSPGEILLGDGIALASALLYGLYSVLLKRRLGHAGQVHMPLFFGFVGLFNLLLVWPGFLVMHFTGVERFLLPPNSKVVAVLALNAVTSLLSDLAWALAVLLTSPIVVAVGLSLTIPLSLVGQVVLNGQTSGPAYWFGAAVVVVSFVFVNHDENGTVGPA